MTACAQTASRCDEDGETRESALLARASAEATSAHDTRESRDVWDTDLETVRELSVSRLTSDIASDRSRNGIECELSRLRGLSSPSPSLASRGHVSTRLSMRV